jgi:hypothetical protein
MLSFSTSFHWVETGVLIWILFFFLLQRRADIEGLLQSLPEAKEFARTV